MKLSGKLIEEAKHLTPDMPDFEAVLSEELAVCAAETLGMGKVADYIPALGSVAPDQFGVAIAFCDGKTFEFGKAEERFSIQSISKLFSLVLAIKLYGRDIWSRINRNPTVGRFNSISELESNDGIPSNPFVNAGALVVTDAVISRSSAPGRIVLDLVRRLSGNPNIYVDTEVSDSEISVGNRNYSLGYLLKDLGNLNGNVDEVLATYCKACAISMNCIDLAKAVLFLANDGISPLTGEEVVSRDEARELNAVLATCGMYNSSGEFAFQVGIPAKSGVGGGIVAVVPQRMTLCVWSPALDENGNSVVGQAMLSKIVRRLGISIY